MSVTTERLRGRAPRRRQPPKRFEPGRVCGRPDCGTKLSTYNRSDVCFAHAPLQYPKPRGRAAA
jgi:hypothetical protein